MIKAARASKRLGEFIRFVSFAVASMSAGTTQHFLKQSWLCGRIVKWASAGVFAALGAAAFALGCQTAAFHAYNTLEDANLQRWTWVCVVAVGVGALLCMITGFAGYVPRAGLPPPLLSCWPLRRSKGNNALRACCESFLMETVRYFSFLNFVDGEILDSFPDSDIPAQVFRIFLVVHLILYYPVHFAIMRHSLAKLFGQDVLQMELKFYIPITVRSFERRTKPHGRPARAVSVS